MARVKKNQAKGKKKLSKKQMKKTKGGLGGDDVYLRGGKGVPKLGGPVRLGGGESEWD